MKRPGRWLFNLAAAVSIIACILTVFLWIRGYSTQDRLLWHTASSLISLNSFNGRIALAVTPNATVSPWTSSANWALVAGKPPTLQHDATRNAPYSFMGFGYLPNRDLNQGMPPGRFPPQFSGVAYFLPHWILLCIFMMLPLHRLQGFARKRLGIARGLCSKCGYDLRATPDRCPECGEIPETAKGATP